MTVLWPSEVWVRPCCDDDIGIAVVIVVVVDYALIDGITGLGVDGEGGVVGLRGVVEQGGFAVNGGPDIGAVISFGGVFAPNVGEVFGSGIPGVVVGCGKSLVEAVSDSVVMMGRTDQQIGDE